MPPRKPLSQVSANAPLPSRRQAIHGKNAKAAAVAKEENDVLKAQVADLTAQLEKAKLEPTSATAPAEEKKNPFGGIIPTAATIAGVAPKRPQTAYQRFLRENRQDVKDQFPDANVHEINAKLAEMWKSATAEEQADYHAQVEQDRQRYEREMKSFNEQRDKLETERLAIEYWCQQLKQKKAMEFYEAHLANMKDTSEKAKPEPPKQARSAYNFFSAAQHKDLANKNLSLGEAAGLVSEQWAKLQTSKSKKNKELLRVFQQMATDDEVRYEQEMGEYQTRVKDMAAVEAQEREEFAKAALEAYSRKVRDEADAKAFRKLQAEQKEVAKLERKKAREEKQAAKAAKADEPRRPRNAYAMFFADQAAEVSDYLKANSLEHSMAKEIADRWKSLNARKKSKYEKAASDDRARYDKEMEAYKAKQGMSK